MSEQESSEFTRKVWFTFSVLLIIAGIAFYWGWGIMFNTWNPFIVENIGAYVITFILLGFGIIGALLNRKKQSNPT
jgi:FtsH-binding integral membrane protein